MVERAGCQIVMCGDAGYPPALRAVANPPDVLFVRGTIPRGPSVAVVGTRRCTGYGRGLAGAFGRAVADAGWVMVSGLARGIDGEVHRGTLDADGRGVGVLGCGPDVVYPRENRDLFVGLTRRGAVISEYPPGTRPHGWRFPPRNRIISGLAAAVVVVEAGVTGGALVTAGLAAGQGRELFAVPGDVDREASVGCNQLIRDGAVPVLGPEDLIEALSLVLGPPHRSPHLPRLPARGVPVDDLAASLELRGKEFSAWLGREELAGRIVIHEGRVCPAD